MVTSAASRRRRRKSAAASLWYTSLPNEEAKIQYHPDDFLRLAEEVEAQGGVNLPRRCNPRKFKLPLPKTGGGKGWKELFTTGCGQESLFEIPYSLPGGRLGKKMRDRGGGLVVACAVDDDMGKWPRFANTIQEDSF